VDRRQAANTRSVATFPSQKKLSESGWSGLKDRQDRRGLEKTGIALLKYTLFDWKDYRIIIAD
jgi:hypothetical protein